MRYRGLVAGSLSFLFLASCSGGGNAPIPVAAPGALGKAPNAHRKRVHVRVRIVIPSRKARTKSERHERFIAASTKGVQFQSYPAGSTHSTSNVLSTQVASVAKNAPGCTTNANGTRTCSFTLDLYPGDLVVTTWDAAPADGAIPSSAAELAADDDVNAIKTGQANVLALTLGGVVSSIQLALPNPSTGGGEPTQYIHGTIPSNWTVGLNALDADGNVILTDTFVDAAGDAQPIAVALTSTGSTCGSATISAGGSTGGANLTIAKPLATGIQFAYGAVSTAGLITGSATCSFGLHASAGTTVNAYGAFALLGPKIVEYQITPNGTGVQPSSITGGPDGNIYFGDTNTKVFGQFVLATQTFNVVPTGGPIPYWVAPGLAKSTNVWFAEGAGIQPFSTSAVPGTVFNNGGTVGRSNGIALGPDGNLWFTDEGTDSVGMITTGGTITEYPVPTTAAVPFGIVAGSDGNLWFTECSKNKIGRMTITGVATDWSLSTTTPAHLASGPDGALWVQAGGLHSIVRFDVTTQTQTTNISVVSPDQVSGIAGGPDDAVWFTDGANNRIGRIPASATATASQIEYFSTPTTNAFPTAITLGPDGNIWFTEPGVGHAGGIGQIAEMLW